MIDFLTNGAEKIRHPYANKINLDTDLIPYTKLELIHNRL